MLFNNSFTAKCIICLEVADSGEQPAKPKWPNNFIAWKNAIEEQISGDGYIKIGFENNSDGTGQVDLILPEGEGEKNCMRSLSPQKPQKLFATF